MKVCSRCKLLKDEIEFGKDKYSRDGLNYSCKKCKLKEPKSKTQSGYKVCRSCKKEKQNTDFDKHVRNSDGLRCSCRECRDKVSLAIKSKIKKKVCSKCGIEKELSEFSKLSASRDGKYPSCKECRSIDSLKYYSKNHLKIKEYQKEYAILNPDKLIEQRKGYYSENSETIKKHTAEYYRENKKILAESKSRKRSLDPEKYRKKKRESDKERKARDPESRLRAKISSAFTTSFKRYGMTKEDTRFSYTGISQSEYAAHLKNDPLWEDYVNKSYPIHVDHVLPLFLFQLECEDEIKKAWNPRNLRFLPASENLSKGKKFIPELVDQYQIHDLLPNKLRSIHNK